MKHVVIDMKNTRLNLKAMLNRQMGSVRCDRTGICLTGFLPHRAYATHCKKNRFTSVTALADTRCAEQFNSTDSGMSVGH